MGGDGDGSVGVVGHHGDVGAGGVQLGDLVQLPRRDADRVQDVGHAVGSEVLRFRQGADGDGGEPAGRRHAGDVDAFCRLHVRAQRYAQRRRVGRHAVQVPREHPAVEHQARGMEVSEAHRERLDPGAGVARGRMRRGRDQGNDPYAGKRSSTVPIVAKDTCTWLPAGG